MEEEKQELDTSEEEIEVEEKSLPEQPPMDEFALSGYLFRSSVTLCYSKVTRRTDRMRSIS